MVSNRYAREDAIKKGVARALTQDTYRVVVAVVFTAVFFIDFFLDNPLAGLSYRRFYGLPGLSFPSRKRAGSMATGMSSVSASGCLLRTEILDRRRRHHRQDKEQ